MSIVLGYDVTHQNLRYAPVAGQSAGYVTGTPDVVWTSADWQAHPNAIRIDQSPVNTALDETADVLDFENGAATLADIVPWSTAALKNYANVVRPGQRLPLIYMSGNNVTAVANELTKGGLTKGNVGLWVAIWDDPKAAIDVLNAAGPFPVHGFQYANLQLFDVDVFSVAWLNTRASRPVPPPVVHEGIVVTSALDTFRVDSTDMKNWHLHVTPKVAQQ